MRRAGIGLVVALAACGAPAEAPSAASRTRRQLDELYRPLLAMVQESRRSVEAYLAELGRDYIHPTEGELQGPEREAWLKKAEGDLMPRNERMCALIRSKRELIDGRMPASWQALLDHQDGWKAAHEKWKKDGMPYGLRAPKSFPRRLENDLLDDIAKLEARLAREKD